MERKCIRAALFMVALAVFLRLMSLGLVTKVFSNPKVLSGILLLETGRVITRQVEKTPTHPAEPEVQTPTQVAETPTQIPSFSSEDKSLVAVNNLCDYSVDVGAMLSSPLNWELTGGEPKVLILHSHGSESYQNAENSGYRSLDNSDNMVCVGAHLKDRLEAAGIGVIHDTTLHDQPSYNDSYVAAREAIAAYLEDYPSICLVLDLHRDAVESEGQQLKYTVSIEGESTAQLMLVVGTDAGGRHHPNWQENMSLAVKLHAQLERQNPGICRAISFRTQRFNQDLCPGGMLIEVGAAGNSLEEALLAAERLADGIIALAHGSAGAVY